MMKYTNCTSFFQAINANNVLCTILYPKFLLMFGWLGEFLITEVSKHHHCVTSGFRCHVNEIFSLLEFYSPKIGSSDPKFREIYGHIFRVTNLLDLLDPKNIRWVKFQKNADHKLQNSLDSHNLFSSIRLQYYTKLLQC